MMASSDLKASTFISLEAGAYLTALPRRLMITRPILSTSPYAISISLYGLKQIRIEVVGWIFSIISFNKRFISKS